MTGRGTAVKCVEEMLIEHTYKIEIKKDKRRKKEMYEHHFIQRINFFKDIIYTAIFDGDKIAIIDRDFSSFTLNKQFFNKHFKLI